jgi:hypothetical protein
MDNTVVANVSAQRDAVKGGAASAHGLADRGRALEDKWFHDRDRELIAKLQAEKPAAAPAATAEATADPEAGCMDDCRCCPNPRSDRLLE